LAPAFKCFSINAFDLYLPVPKVQGEIEVKYSEDGKNFKDVNDEKIEGEYVVVKGLDEELYIDASSFADKIHLPYVVFPFYPGCYFVQLDTNCICSGSKIRQIRIFQ